ncbi:MAG: MMPL family transporter [Gammaproteobacteria bacterium]|nr:MMPL family transporter [Gammaproteobacteria bacterium]
MFLTLIAFVISALLATGILRNGFDTSIGALLTQSDPYLDELEILADNFPNDLEINFAFVAKEGETVFQPQLLRAIEQLENRYQEIPFSQRISSITNFVSPETQLQLFERPLDSYSQQELNTLETIAVNDRLLTANLLSSDASLTFALIYTNGDEADTDQRLEIANTVLSIRDDLRQSFPEIGVHANSEVLLEQSSQQAMIDDLTTLLPLVILACVLAICYCFKSAILGICILSHTVLTIICTAGTLGYLGFSFNTVSIMAPLVVVIISVANSVHVISIYKQFLLKGMTKVEAMEESMAYNFQPISLAALTTAIGFTSLNMCSSPAIQDFGQIVAIGIIFAYILPIIYLPAVLVFFSKDAEQMDKTQAPFLHNTLEKICELTRVQDKPIFWSCSALALITFLMLPLNETDFNRLDFIASDDDIKEYYDEVSDRLNRGPALTYAIDTGSDTGAIEPEFLKRMENFTDWLSTQDEVESVGSVVDVVKTIHQVQNDDDADYYEIPDNRGTVLDYLLGYTQVESKDFPVLGFVTADLSMMSLFINAIPMSNQEMIDLDLRLTEKFEEDFPEADLIHGSGLLLFARMDELVTIELLQGYSLSLLLITITLIIGLRSVYFGILSVLPNLLPATIVFGMWALLVGQLDPFVMMLFSISIGLVVDDTVHLLSHYLDDRRKGAAQPDAISHAIKPAGPALSITTLILALGTTILIFASTVYFQQAAKLLVPIVVIALVLDLLYLPTILKRFDKKELS